MKKLVSRDQLDGLGYISVFGFFSDIVAYYLFTPGEFNFFFLLYPIFAVVTVMFWAPIYYLYSKFPQKTKWFIEESVEKYGFWIYQILGWAVLIFLYLYLVD